MKIPVYCRSQIRTQIFPLIHGLAFPSQSLSRGDFLYGVYMYKSDEINELAAAVVKFQGEMAAIEKKADNPYFKSKYADIEAIIAGTQEPLAKNGLSVIQTPYNEGENVGIDTMLLHSSGQYIGERFAMPCIKPNPQEYGKTLTYFRRYGLNAILRLASTDDDGNTGADHYKRSEAKLGASNATTSVDTGNVVGTGLNWRIPLGKYKGKTVGETGKDNLHSYLMFVSENGTKELNGDMLELSKQFKLAFVDK